MRVTVFALAAAFLAAPALAQTDPAPPAAPTQEQTATTENEPATSGRQDPDEEVICRWVQSSTETRLRRTRTRICGTRTQWEIMEDENRRQMINRGSIQGEKG